MPVYVNITFGFLFPKMFIVLRVMVDFVLFITFGNFLKSSNKPELLVEEK